MARQSRPLPVLLTRPEPQATRFAAQVAGRFGPALYPVVSPLIAPRFVTPAVPDLHWGGLILTSETGAEAAARIMAAGQALPPVAYCVGNRTADAARAAGFQPISAEGDADGLVALILAAGADGPLLHLHGADSRGDVAARLAAAGVRTTAAVAYVQDPQPLSPEAAILLRGTDPVLVPLFSPRTARLFATAAQPATAPLLIAALSPAVASACPTAARIQVASRPDAAAMLAAIAGLLDHWAITRHPA